MELFDAGEVQLVRELTEEMRRQGVCEIDLEVGARQLRLRIEPVEGQRELPALPPLGTIPVVSPGVGRFLRAHPARAHVEAAEGKLVDSGTVIGYVVSGDILRPVAAPATGHVTRFLISSGEFVSFGYRLAEVTSTQP